MKWSNTPIKTLRDNPVSASIESHILLVRGGYVHPLASGLFTYTPFMVRVISKLEKIIRQELEKINYAEIFMPMVQPKEIWEETGRWEIFSEILQKMKNRSGQEFCLGPTHEEVVTDYVRDNIKSYRDLPFGVYQIQTKYRDEYRPRFGLLRAREFGMKDAYSFDLDSTSSLKSFEKMEKAYHVIFSKLGVQYCVVKADSGSIGGDHSREFHILAEQGEDELYISKDKKQALNKEIIKKENITNFDGFEKYRGIEVAHIFHLGTQYSEKMKAHYLDKSGKKKSIEMGCYGIGVTRTIQAVVEQSHDKEGIIWPWSLCPFKIHLLPIHSKMKQIQTSENVRKISNQIYETLWGKNIDVFFDDRDEPAGVKFKDADLLGLPLRLTVGEKDLKQRQVEIVDRKTGEKTKLSVENAIDFIINKTK